MTRGFWNMPCWNSLSVEQQKRLIEWGNLPFGYEPEGHPSSSCNNGAEVAVETQWDESSGPRFYCVLCAIQYLMAKGLPHED